MAPRREEKNVRKLNRTNYRRSGGRTAEFFDLRETDETSNSDSRSSADTRSSFDNRGGAYSGNRYDSRGGAYSGNRYDSRGGAYSGTGYDSRSSAYSGSGSYSGQSTGAGGYGDSYGTGFGNTDESRPYRERHRVEVTGRDSYYNRAGDPSQKSVDEDQFLSRGGRNRESRIVRGNAPGSRGTKADVADRREIAPDLLYSGTGSTRNRSTGGRYGRIGSRYSYYDDELPYDRFQDNLPPDEDFDSDELYDETDRFDEEESRRKVQPQRLRQSARERRLREQQIRGFYLRTGIGAAVLIALLIFIVPRAAGGILSLKDREKNREQGQAVAVAQEDVNQEDTGTHVEDAQTDLTEEEDAGPAGTAALHGEEGPSSEVISDTTPETTTETNPEASQETSTEKAAGQEDSGVMGQDAAAAQGEAGTGQTATVQSEPQQADSQQTSTVQADSQQKDPEQADPEQTKEEEKTPENVSGNGGQAQTLPGETAAGTENADPAAQGGESAGSLTGETDSAIRASGTAGAEIPTAAESGLYTRQDDWRFILVNPWYKLPEEFEEVDTTALPSGESVDSRCYGELVKMLDDCRAARGEPIVCSSYRPHEKQVGLYEDQVNRLLASGKTRKEAEAEAGTVVAVPGTSEHELGLAVDICDYKNQNLDETQAETTTQKWLIQHSWEYGFILRYPENKSDITGIIYEPWHYRYVGREAAEEITKNGVCLEEYLKQE